MDPLRKQASMQESSGLLLANTLAVSTFSPNGSRLSNGMSVRVCGWNELEVCTVLAYYIPVHYVLH